MVARAIGKLFTDMFRQLCGFQVGETGSIRKPSQRVSRRSVLNLERERSAKGRRPVHYANRIKVGHNRPAWAIISFLR